MNYQYSPVHQFIISSPLDLSPQLRLPQAADAEPEEDGLDDEQREVLTVGRGEEW